MSENKKVVPRKGPGLIGGLTDQVKLALRLFADSRVPLWTKFLPLTSLIYLFWPIDLWPIIPIDDAVVVTIGTYAFFEVVPQEVVKEHRDAIRQERMEKLGGSDAVDANFLDARLRGRDGRRRSFRNLADE